MPRSPPLHSPNPPLLTRSPPKEVAASPKEAAGWGSQLPIFSSFLVGVDAIPLGTVGATVRLRHQPISPRPIPSPFPGLTFKQGL